MAPDPEHGRLPLRQAGRKRAGPADAACTSCPSTCGTKYTGNDGKDLKTFLPEDHLPVVSGGPFKVTKYEKKGQTVFKPNPGWWGTKPHVDAVAYVYYTNADSMIADLQSGQISAVDQVPFTAVNAVKKAAESRSTPIRAVRSRTSPGTRTRTSHSTGSCSTPR